MVRPALLLVLLGLSASAASQPTAFRLDDQLATAATMEYGVVWESLPSSRATAETFLLPPSATASLVGSTVATAAGVWLAANVYNLGDREDNWVQDAGLVLIAVAPTVAPSVGNLWLGENRDALIGLGIRAVGTGAMVYGLSRYQFDGPPNGSEFVFLAGAATFLTGLGYEVVTQHRNGTRARVQLQQAGMGVGLRLSL